MIMRRVEETSKGCSGIRRSLALGAACLFAIACSSSAESQGGGGGGGGGGGAATVVAYAGTYEVPVPAELQAAATYDVAEIEWVNAGGVVSLEYDLPEGLVGQKIRVRFTGVAADGATSAELTGEVGTATCAIAKATVSCNETMSNLVFQPDLTVIEALAATEYAGPAADRLDVAQRFQADPIGIVHIDLSKQVVDDNPGVDDH